MKSTIETNIIRIREKISEAAARSGRKPSDIKLMAVTKTVDDSRIREAIEAGVDVMGENYIQEATKKIEKIGKTLPWHMIGYLQSNKAKYAVRLFDMVHSLDRVELAVELDRRAKLAGKTLNVLIEINISGETTKSGVPIGDALPLIKNIAILENLSIQGLMTMPPWFDDPEDARPYFIALRDLSNRVTETGMQGADMRQLSMGMSGDYEVAVEEGATIVRVGRAIFGERK